MFWKEFKKGILAFIGLLGVGIGYSVLQTQGDPEQYLSQSFLRLQSGMIQAIPAITKDYTLEQGPKLPALDLKGSMSLLDKRNPLPKTSHMGGNFAFFKDAASSDYFLATVDVKGNFYYKGKMNFLPDVIGGNYFTKKGTQELVLVDKEGCFIETGTSAPAIRIAGGNYFIDQNGVLTTIRSQGLKTCEAPGMYTRKDGYNFSKAFKGGGNFFMTTDRTVVTVASTTGFFSDPPYVPDSMPTYYGGNYYVGNDGYLYTISHEGILYKQDYIGFRPATFGYSYIAYDDGSFIFIDGKGQPTRQAVWISTTGVKRSRIQKLQGKIDRNSVLDFNR